MCGRYTLNHFSRFHWDYPDKTGEFYEDIVREQMHSENLMEANLECERIEV